MTRPAQSTASAKRQTYEIENWTAAVSAIRTITVGPTSTVIAVGDGSYRGLLLFNSGGVAVYVALLATASSATYTRMLQVGGYYEIGSSYQGEVSAVTAGGGFGTLQLTLLMQAGYSGVAA